MSITVAATNDSAKDPRLEDENGPVFTGHRYVPCNTTGCRDNGKVHAYQWGELPIVHKAFEQRNRDWWVTVDRCPEPWEQNRDRWRVGTSLDPESGWLAAAELAEYTAVMNGAFQLAGQLNEEGGL